MKFTFTLDEEDLSYFRRLLREARSYAKGRDESEIVAAVRELVARDEGELRVGHVDVRVGLGCRTRVARGLFAIGRAHPANGAAPA